MNFGQFTSSQVAIEGRTSAGLAPAWWKGAGLSGSRSGASGRLRIPPRPVENCQDHHRALFLIGPINNPVRETVGIAPPDALAYRLHGAQQRIGL